MQEQEAAMNMRTVVCAACVMTLPSLLIGVQPSPVGPPPLSGPRVDAANETPARQTLVERDFDGEVRRVETTPEEAAVAILDLDDETRARVERVFRERMKLIDAFVAENLDLLTKFGTADATGNKLDQLSLGLQAFNKLKPLRERGPLQDEIESLLPEASRAKFRSLVNGYWKAIHESHVAAARKSGDRKEADKAKWQVMLDEKLKALGKEIERSAYRLVKNGELIYRYIAQGLNLTEEQAGKVRTKCHAFADEVGDKEATKAQQVKLFLAVWADLDNTQRKELGKRINGKK